MADSAALVALAVVDGAATLAFCEPVAAKIPSRVCCIRCQPKTRGTLELDVIAISIFHCVDAKRSKSSVQIGESRFEARVLCDGRSHGLAAHGQGVRGRTRLIGVVRVLAAG